MSNHSLIEHRTFGSTGEQLSVLGFGGVLVTNTPTRLATEYVAEAFDRGINYFDVAPLYGNAQERLGPALAPYRKQCFLACKSRKRTAEGLTSDLDESLRLLRTDRIDLYQLHALQDMTKDVEVAFAPGGAMEAVVRARKEGKVRYIGFSAHTEEAAHAAMDRFAFDSVLFPFNYFTWTFGNFGPGVLRRAREKGMAALALKSLAHRRWTDEEQRQLFRPWPKCWYRPLEEKTRIELALRFTLGLGVDAAVPPGHWELFRTCLEIAELGPLHPVCAEELEPLRLLAKVGSPLFGAV